MPPLPATLTDFDCSSNQLSSLPPLPTTLTDLNCSYNQLSSLPTLPDSLRYFYCKGNSNLACLPQLKKVVHFEFNGTDITCLPNYPQRNTYSNPPLNTVPLCNLFNPSACDVYWNISGTTYYDANSNCINDVTEPTNANLKVQLYSGGSLQQEVFTNSDGSYSFDTNYGTYTYSLDSSNIPFTVSCPAAGFRTSNITALDSMDFSMDFGLRCKQGFDVGVQSVVASGTFRPASFRIISIDAGDMTNFYGAHCAAGTSGTVQAVLSGPFTYISNAGGLAPSSVAGNTITWSIADFGSVNFFNDFAIQVQTDTLAQAGNVVCITVTVTPTAGDNNPANNTLSHCWTVVNSYDPNIKEVYPMGEIPAGTEWLTYTIHFQNTGNAPAEHIYVDDTLDTNLDVSSFQLLAYSHQNLTQVFAPEHRVRFNFPNINLPDSNSNEPQSHGYVQYKIKRLPNLAPGTAISNTASIYFDFNPPVVTNTVTNNMCTAAITDVSASTCSNQPYSFNGLQLSQAGDYTDTVKFLNRCDSVTALHLAILNTSSFAFTESICSGSSYNFYGSAITTPGNYTHTLINTLGCDSVISLTLNVISITPTGIADAVCENEFYNFNGTLINAAGLYYDTLQNANGCDSIVTLTLYTTSPSFVIVDTAIQEGQTYTLPGGTIVNTAGTYTDTLVAANSCDSVITTELSVISAVAEVSGQKSEIRLNPNPTQDAFMVSVSDNLIGETLEITDAIGKLVFQSKISHVKSEISASNWCAGVYFVKAGDIVKRLVVE